MTGALDDSQRFQVEEARDVLFNWNLTAPHSDREMVLAGQVRNLLAIIGQAFPGGQEHEARRKAETDLERLQQAIRSPVVWLGGLACGMRKVYGANGEDWALWADNIEKAASELAALLPENQEDITEGGEADA